MSDLVPVESSALIASTPEAVVQRASAIATQLAEVIKRTNTSVTISGRKHVKVEGWTTLLAMLMVQPRVEWTRRVASESGITYEARVVLVHASGREVASGEAMASDNEPNAKRSWGRDEFSVRSMAQTRAVGKAARLGFSWIMVLAGYEAAPAEEIRSDVASEPGTGSAPTQRRRSPPRPKPVAEDPKDSHRRRAFAVLRQLCVAEFYGQELLGTDDYAKQLRRSLIKELMGEHTFDPDFGTEENWRAFADKLSDIRDQNIPPADIG